jgi:hypothetical protein
VRCGEQCVGVMDAPSICHPFATSIISFVDAHLEVTLKERFPMDRIFRDNEQGSELDVRLAGRKCLEPARTGRISGRITSLVLPFTRETQ